MRSEMKQVQAEKIDEIGYTINYLGYTISLPKHLIYKYIAIDKIDNLYYVMLYEFIPTIIEDKTMWNNSSYLGKFNDCRIVLKLPITTNIDWKDSLTKINYENN